MDRLVRQGVKARSAYDPRSWAEHLKYRTATAEPQADVDQEAALPVSTAAIRPQASSAEAALAADNGF
jgi:hypothetical protein